MSLNVSAELLYLEDSSEPPVSIMTAAGDGTVESRGTYAAHRLPIGNARLIEPAASLDVQGFELCRHRSSVRNFYDAGEVRRVYYPEVEKLVTETTGAREVVVFDHNTRAEARLSQRDSQAREPVHLVHNDFTPWSGPDRVERELGHVRARQLATFRLAIVNVWRPITGPLESKPLAMCDAQTLGENDLVAADMVYAHRTGSEFRSRFSAAHRWYYHPRLETDEVILLKVCDTAEDGRARCCLHSAFDDPNTAPDARPRESIEVRVMAFFEG